MTDPDDATLSRQRAGAEDAEDAGARSDKVQRTRRGVFARIALFLRQVVAELKKVIWPTRRDLVSYTWIVIVFCAIMAAFIALCDFVFGKGVLYVFGG